MAIFTAANAFDTESFIASGSLGELFNFGQVVAGTADTFALDYSDEEKSEQLILTGVFGDYVDDFPTSGTITDAAYTLDGLQLFSMSGLSMPVEQFTAFVRADDILQLFQSLLSGADEVYGSDGDDVLMGFAGNDVIDGGDGLDRLAGGDGDDRLVVSVAPVEGDVFDGGNGIDTLQFMASAGEIASTINGPIARGSLIGTTLSSIERLEFGSAADTGLSINIMFNQVGAGLSPTAELVGGDGLDQLTVIVTGGGTYTAPSFTYANWELSADPFTPGDVVVLVAAGPGNFTLNAAAGHAGVQALVGSSGDDTLNGTDGREVLVGGGGVNILNGGAGDDVLAAVNSAPYQGATTSFNFAGSQFNGGGGVDYLSVGGFVNFQGTLSSIEGIRFQPAFTATGPGVNSQGDAELVIGSATLAALPADLILSGFGLLVVNLGGGNYDASGWLHADGSAVGIEFFGDDSSQTIVGSTGNDRFSGGFGSDVLTGNGGFNEFEAGDGQHVVTDFTLGADVVDLTDMNFTSFDQLLPYLSQVGADVVFSRLFGGVAQTMTLKNIQLGDLTAESFHFQLGGEDDTRIGTDLADELFGAQGNDTLEGRGGDDILVGGAGNDRIDPGLGADVVHAGSGDDTIVFGSVSSGAETPFGSIDGGDGFDTIDLRGVAPVTVGTLSDGANFYPGFYVGSQGYIIAGVERILLGDGDQYIGLPPGNVLDLEVRGGAGADSFQGGSTNRFFGEDGNDSFFISGVFGGASTTGLINGGSGINTLSLNILFTVDLAAGTATSGDATYTISSIQNVVAHNDSVVSGDAGSNRIEVSDMFDSASGGVTFEGREGNDLLSGSMGADHLDGGADDDVVEGGDGNDMLIGGSGNDTLRGGLGDDQLYGGDGNDFLSEASGDNGPFGDDLYDGGAGTDRVSLFTAFGPGVTVDLRIEGAQDTGSMGTDTFVGIEHITANFGDDTLIGNESANWFWTFSGTDNLSGNGGNDYFTVGQGDKIADGGSGIDTIEISDTAFEPLYSAAGIALSLELQGAAQATGVGNWTLTNMENLGGAWGDDRLTGDANANVLAGAQGNDTLRGGDGNDMLAGDGAFDLDENGAQIFLADPDWVGGNDVLEGGAGDDALIGGGGDDTLRGGLGSDQLYGGAGNDFLAEASGDNGPFGDDLYDGGAGSDRVSMFTSFGPGVTIDLNLETAQNTGSMGTDTFIGIEHITANYGDDTLTGNESDNWFWTFSGTDNLTGNGGNDYFTVGQGDKIADGGTGVDTIEISDMAFEPLYGAAGITLSLELQGAAQATEVGGWTLTNMENLGGSWADDRLTGDAGANVLAGHLGNDTLRGGDGNDVLAGDGTWVFDNGAQSFVEDNVADGAGGNDILEGGAGDDTLLGGRGHDFLRGNAGADVMHGGDGDDFLNGGGGDDLMDGGAGIDRVAYGAATGSVTVDLNLEGVAQATGLGNDTLVGIEHVTGGSFDDTLTGNAADNWLWGIAGNDTIRGGDGNDLIDVGSGTQMLDGGAGDDTLRTYTNVNGGISVSLGLQGAAQDSGQGMMTLSGFENLTGGAFNDQLTGDAGANILGGFDGDDRLAGGAGNDTLYGDGGIDIDSHDVGASGPMVWIEDASSADVPGGNDTLEGGEGDDRLVGGGGNDFLDGGAGNDVMIGGSGNDVYIMDGDAVIEEADGGTDEIRTSVSWGLAGSNVENLTATGLDDIFLGGSDFANVLTGNSGNNYIVGEGGNDLIDGGIGRDVASFGLPAGTPGNLVLIDGTGADAGKLLVQLVDGDSVQTVARVTLGVNGSAVVEGVGLGARWGTDTITNIEELHFLEHTTDGSNATNLVVINLTVRWFGDFVSGSDLSDTIDLNDYPAAISANGNRGDDSITGTEIDNNLEGGAGNDVLLDETGNDYLDGNDGNDVLQGGDGDDYMAGSDGNDSVDGGAGRDVAAFRLAAGTTGTLRVADGADGALLVQLVQANGSVEDVFAISFAENGGVTVTGMGVAAAIGTDTITNVEDLHFLIDNWPQPIGDGQFVNIPLAVHAPGIVNGFAHVEGSARGEVIDLAALYPDAGSEVDINVTGGRGDDVITGTGGSNYMRGDAGNDRIDGGGNDQADFDVAAYGLPAGMTGALRVVAGTGDNAGRLVVERVDGATIEQLFIVSFDEAGTATVQGINSAAFLGTDTVTNVNSLDFTVDNPVFDPAQFAHIIVPRGTTSGNDVIFGGGDSDAMFGGDGHDFLRGNGGADVIHAGGGDDFLNGGGGDDLMDGGAGIDRVAYGAATGSVTVDLNLEGVAQATGLGNDTLVGIEHVTGGSFDDTLTGNAADNWLWGIAGNDTIRGGDGNDLIDVGSGTQMLDGGAGNDTLRTYTNVNGGISVSLGLQGAAQDSGQGMMTLSGFENLTGGAFNDQLTGDGGANIVGGFDGDDRLAGGAGNDTLYGDGGIDIDSHDVGASGPMVWIEDASSADVPGGNDTLEGGDGDDRLVGGGGDDFLDGGAGNDVMIGGSGNDVYIVDGDAVIEEVDGGIDEIRSSIDWGLSGSNVENLTASGSGNIFLGGSDVANVLTGNSGNNYIVGEGGNDIIDGGGNVAEGDNSGRDIASYQLAAGLTGTLVVVDGIGDDAGKLLVQLVDGATVQTVLKVTLTGQGSATVEGVGPGADMGTDTVTNIEELHIFVRTSDGSPTAEGQFVGVSLTPNKFGDFVSGSELSDGIDLANYAGALNANGNRGDDSITGTEASNNLEGGVGNDVLQGLGGEDYLIGGEGDDSIDGGTGADDIAAFRLPAGTAGTIAVVDGTGADAGMLLVQITNGGVTQTFLKVTLTGQGGATVEGVGIGAFLGTDTVSNIDQLHIYVNDPNGAPAGQFVAINLSPVQFGDFVAGSENSDTIDLADYAGAINANGNRGDDVITGTEANNGLQGGVGDDTLSGEAGLDFLNGQAGNDTLSGGLDNDTLIGAAGGDTLNGGDGDDVLIGAFNTGFGPQPGDGADILLGDAGNDLIRGGDGDDLLEGGDGDDNLRGDAGSDVLDGGAGEDFASLQFGALTSGITFDGRAIGATGTSTIVDPLGGTDTLISIEKIGIGGTNFDDIIYGSEHFAPTDAYANQLYGNGGNDQLFGASAQDFLDGGDGNDSLEGGDGADTLIGGAGDDALHGGSADDFLVGDAGNDTIDGGTGADDIATFYLPGTTLGSLRAVDGTGADAGTILIERVDGAEVEVIAKITITGQGATVQGLGSAAFLGTDTITNVDRLLFSVATADPVSNPYDPDAYAVVQLASGVVSDGYIAGSTVFIDANDNGLLDAGEASTVTDAAGNFTFASASTGTVRAVGGINIDTGLPNLLTLSAPDGSSVINPLTTLVQTIVQQGDGAVSIEQAQGQVLASLGLSPSIDLSNVDILTAAATDADALAAQRAAVMIATILVGAGEAAGADGAATAITAALQNLAGQVSAPDSQVDLTNSATISAIITAGLPEGTDADAVITLLGNATQSISTAADVGAIADVQHEAVVALDQTAPNRPSFTLDAESDTGVSHSDRLTADLAPTLRGVAEAGSIVSIYSGNELIGSTVTAANGSWQFTATLAAGVQNLIATATDASGNVSEDASLSFTIDTTAVTLAAPDLDSASDSGRSSSDNVTNDTTPTVRGGGAEAGATVNLYASDGTTVLGSAIADSAGAWSITSSSLAAGTHDLTVRQIDLAGNVSASSSALRTTIDVAAQAPSIHSPAGTADPTPVISGTAEANASIAIHNAAGVVVGTALANDAGAWSFRLEAPLARGQNGFALVATDAAGNVSASVTTTVALVDARNDFNGDGRSDILWRDDAGQVSNWLATSSGGFNNNAGSVMAMSSDWKVAGTGDFNGDGREDILWRQDGSGTVTEWLANAQGGYAANDAATVRVGLDWHIFGVGDFNGDGRSDILWEQNGGALINWLGKADGSFTSNAANFSTVVGTEWRVVGTSDYNGDGRSDILWRKDGSGQVLNWLATSDGGFNTNGDATVNVGLDWHISGTGDFNGDGIGDILWRQNGGLTIDWLGTSTGVFTSNAANFATVIGTEWRVVGTGDYNGDAIDDLLWRQDGSGHVIDWLGTANGGFQTNAANFDVNVPASMHVQDAFLPFI